MSSATHSVPSRILVADDQTDVLEALRWLLTGEGYTPDFVSSTDGVMEKLGDRPYDLLLMDLNYTRDTTSGREGLELIDRVRAFDPSLPIVVMTGWGSIDMAVEAMRRGAKSFVQKPWEDTALLEIIAREVVEGRAARERDQRLQHELEEARRIQRGLLPTTFPAVPRVDLSVTWVPAEGVGGDCFDALGFGDVLAVAIADIAGKGLPAALLMSNLQAAVRAFALENVSPASITNSVNRLLCRNMANGRFATFCFARIEPAAGRIVYANGGHNPPLLLRADGSMRQLREGGMVLGVFSDYEYQQTEAALAPGDRVLFYTDGITEARNAAGEEYGEARLEAVARGVRSSSADAIRDAVLADVNAFTGGTFEDDATLIVVGISQA